MVALEVEDVARILQKQKKDAMFLNWDHRQGTGHKKKGLTVVKL